MQYPWPCVGSGPHAWQARTLRSRAFRCGVAAPAAAAPASAASVGRSTFEPARGEPERATTRREDAFTGSRRPRVRRAPLLDVRDGVLRRAAGAEQLADALRLQRRDVLRRDDAAAREQHVRRALGHEL